MPPAASSASRVAVVFQPDRLDPAMVAWARLVAPAPDEVLGLCWGRAPVLSWVLAGADQPVGTPSDSDRAALHGWGRTRFAPLPGLTRRQLEVVLAEDRIDLLLIAQLPEVRLQRQLGWLVAAARSSGVPVLFCPRGVRPPPERLALMWPFDGEVAELSAQLPRMGPLTARLRSLTWVAEGAVDPHLSDDLPGVARGLGLSCAVELDLVPGGALGLAGFMDRTLAAQAVDLVAVTVTPGVLGTAFFQLVGGPALAAAGLPLLALPPTRERLSPLLDVPDLLYLPGTPVALGAELLTATEQGSRSLGRQLEETLGIAQPERLETSRLRIRVGRVEERVELEHGRAEVWLPQIDSTAVLVQRAATEEQPALDTSAALVVPGEREVVLIDPLLPIDQLRMLATLRRALGPEALFLGVRIQRSHSWRALQERLALGGLHPAIVLDADALLDDGGALDRPDGVDGLRLAQVGGRLRAAGVAVRAVITADAGSLREGPGFLLIPGAELARRDAGVWRERLRAVPGPSGPARQLAGDLDLLTAEPAIGGNQIEFQLHNGDARRWLLSHIREARERVHIQAYIVEAHAPEDGADGFMPALFRALAEAAGRGVRVRMLVDSLWSQHGSLGLENPFLSRLDALEGVEVRAHRPISGLPGFADLKQRDHRKLVITDGVAGQVSGRNLAPSYYIHFDEVELTPLSPWNEVPWLDASTALTGPIVERLERSFAASWAEAGGAVDWAIRPSPPTGRSVARLVEHHGLADLYTLETYLAMIRRAQAEIVLVNTFALTDAILHALLGAIRRGVRVRALVGNIRPQFGDRIPFSGAGAVRELFGQLVLGRLDALVRAGGEVSEFSLPLRPGWSPELTPLRPYVHAKLLATDRRAVAVGSANLDLAASYWESEALLVVEDASLVGALCGELDTLLAHSLPVDPLDPGWRQLAERRSTFDMSLIRQLW